MHFLGSLYTGDEIAQQTWIKFYQKPVFQEFQEYVRYISRNIAFPIARKIIDRVSRLGS